MGRKTSCPETRKKTLKTISSRWAEKTRGGPPGLGHPSPGSVCQTYTTLVRSGDSEPPPGPRSRTTPHRTRSPRCVLQTGSRSPGSRFHQLFLAQTQSPLKAGEALTLWRCLRRRSRICRPWGHRDDVRTRSDVRVGHWSALHGWGLQGAWWQSDHKYNPC